MRASLTQTLGARSSFKLHRCVFAVVRGIALAAMCSVLPGVDPMGWCYAENHAYRLTDAEIIARLVPYAGDLARACGGCCSGRSPLHVFLQAGRLEVPESARALALALQFVDTDTVASDR